VSLTYRLVEQRRKTQMTHRQHSAWLLAALSSSLAPAALSASAAPFTPGNIVVYRIGSTDAGAPVLGTTAAPLFLDEFTPGGLLVQSVPLPTAAIGANHILTGKGDATSEGLITRSADGRYLLVSGYDAPVGTADPSAAAAAAINRVVGRIDSAGAIDTTTAITNAFSGNNVRSATSTNGTDLWVSGTATPDAEKGLFYVPLGGTSATPVVSAIATRNVAVYGGQLYAGTTSGSTLTTIFAAGSGTPTAADTPANLTGLPTANNGSPNQFALVDLSPSVPGLDTLYVADDTGAALRKYSLVGGTWTLNGTIGAGSADYTGLAVTVSDSGVATLFATRLNGANADDLVTLTDASGFNGAFAGTPTVLFAATGNIGLRGIALAPVPEPAGTALLLIGAGALVARRRRHR
jgi:hypothetical protein